MVTKYGMTDTLGPIDLKGKEDYEIQLFGDKIGDKVGEEVKRLIDEAYINAQKLLMEHRDKLDRIALTLIEKEKINESQFNEIFNEYNLYINRRKRSKPINPPSTTNIKY